ncbi:hypothetical protein TNCV_2560801 [Trichonephila clavipes]|uniref:Uncharacterized protein n=1 Tax=Trichonephila clavipes TaxID=2585209 RepID=A0A8X6R0N1_TRICX|nr:hypothetical protein TNCV_2560801 [Trichonephila clavipes]
MSFERFSEMQRITTRSFSCEKKHTACGYCKLVPLKDTPWRSTFGWKRRFSGGKNPAYVIDVFSPNAQIWYPQTRLYGKKLELRFGHLFFPLPNHF